MSVFKRMLVIGAAFMFLATLPTFANTIIQLGITGDAQVGTNYLFFGERLANPIWSSQKFLW
jgi:hypothetical protein